MEQHNDEVLLNHHFIAWPLTGFCLTIAIHYKLFLWSLSSVSWRWLLQNINSKWSIFVDCPLSHVEMKVTRWYTYIHGSLDNICNYRSMWMYWWLDSLHSCPPELGALTQCACRESSWSNQLSYPCRLCFFLNDTKTCRTVTKNDKYFPLYNYWNGPFHRPSPICRLPKAPPTRNLVQEEMQHHHPCLLSAWFAAWMNEWIGDDGPRCIEQLRIHLPINPV